MTRDILMETYEEIMRDAHERYREYQLLGFCEPVGQAMPEKKHFEWWVATSAFAKGIEMGKRQVIE